MKTNSRTIAMVCVLPIVLSSGAEAQFKVNLAVPVYGQDDTNWCAAGSAQMMMMGYPSAANNACIEQAHIGFLFAIKLHPSMKHAAPVRKAVRYVPSHKACGRPVSGSSTNTRPWTTGSPRPRFPGKTETVLVASPNPSTWAPISNVVPCVVPTSTAVRGGVEARPAERREKASLTASTVSRIESAWLRSSAESASSFMPSCLSSCLACQKVHPRPAVIV